MVKRSVSEVTVCARASSVQSCVQDLVMIVAFLLFLYLQCLVLQIANNRDIWVLVPGLEQVTSPCWASVSPSVLKRLSQAVCICSLGILCWSQTRWSGKCCRGGSERTERTRSALEKAGWGQENRRSGNSSLGRQCSKWLLQKCKSYVSMVRRSIFISLWKARRRGKTGKVQKAVSLSVTVGHVATAWVYLLCCKYGERVGKRNGSFRY